MPLLDHFHPPLSLRRDWEGFHSAWIGEIHGRLNQSVLGEKYFAEMQVRLGRSFEVDIATVTEPEHDPLSNGYNHGDGGGTAVAVAPVWAPPSVELEAPTVFPDDFEIRVYSTAAGLMLVGAIELISPGNKDRPQTRQAFAAKVVSYLSRKVGVVIVDIVTDRLSNLHDEICNLLGLGSPYLFEPDPGMYTVAYRPVRTSEGDRIQMWRQPLAVGAELPVMPLGLRNAGSVPVDLNATYTEACRRSRIPLPN